MGTIYDDGTYEALHPTWHVEDSQWKATKILALLAANHIHPRTVCEIGCGAGEILRQMSLSLDATFHGWEVSEAAYRLAKQREAANITFHLGDLLEESRHYDLLLAVDVIEHVDDYIGFLRKLKPRSELKLFHIPLDLSVYYLLRDYPSETRRSSGHLHFFTKETALDSLEYAGYKIRACTYTSGTVELPSSGRLKMLLRGPRKLALRLSPDWAVRVLGGCSLLVLAE